MARKLRLRDLRAHVLVCTGGSCAPKGEQKRALRYLKKRTKELGLRASKAREGGVVCSAVGCLDVCRGGPIAVVWPDGTWYGEAGPDNLERILQEHLLGGRVVDELAIARRDEPGG